MRRISNGRAATIGMAVVASAVSVAGLGGASEPAGAATAFNPAGYIANLTDTISHQISLTVKVPSITCKSAKANDLISASIAGTTGGSSFDAAGVIITMGCPGGKASYSVFGVVDDSHETAPVTVAPGDVIDIAVIASQTFETASFDDTTSGQGTYVDGTGFAADEGAVDVQGGDGTGKFPKFKSVTFNSVKLDDKPFSKAAPTANNQLDAGGHVQISTGPLSAKGTSFVETYVTNS